MDIKNVEGCGANMNAGYIVGVRFVVAGEIEKVIVGAGACTSVITLLCHFIVQISYLYVTVLLTSFLSF